jgi:hypothetical protein
MRWPWDAGENVPAYRPLPLIRIPELDPTAAIANNTALPAEQFEIYHAITWVSKVEVHDGSGWQDLPVTNIGTPFDRQWMAPTEPYRSQLTNNFVLQGLDNLLNQPLGTRKRYVFRVTDYFGRTAYDELVLEVQYNPNNGNAVTEGSKVIRAINLGPAKPAPGALDSDLKAIQIPDSYVLRFNVTPTLNPGSVEFPEILNLSDPIWVTKYASVLLPLLFEDTSLTLPELLNTTSTIPASGEFVIVDTATMPADRPPISHGYPHMRVNTSGNDFDIQATLNPIPGLPIELVDRVTVTHFDLEAFLADDDTEATTPVAVRFHPTGVAGAENFTEDRFLMQPLKLRGTPGGFGTVEMRLEYEGDLTGQPAPISVWQETAPGQGTRLDLTTAEFLATNFTAAQGVKSFLVNGEVDGKSATLVIRYKYRGNVILEDRVRFTVKKVDGLAGESLGQAPYINYVHVFQKADPNDPNRFHSDIAVGLDPFVWQQVTKNQALSATGSQAVYYITPHRSPSEWVTNNSLTIPGGALPRQVGLDGRSIEHNRIVVWENPNPEHYCPVKVVKNRCNFMLNLQL